MGEKGGWGTLTLSPKILPECRFSDGAAWMEETRVKVETASGLGGEGAQLRRTTAVHSRSSLVLAAPCKTVCVLPACSVAGFTTLTVWGVRVPIESARTALQNKTRRAKARG